MIDTHCHIHDDEYGLDADNVLLAARESGVKKVICVGTDAKLSAKAIDFATSRKNVWASAGLHPHDAKSAADLDDICAMAKSDIVIAIGECGLDYHYMNSSVDDQKTALQKQLELATDLNLPVIIHLRGKTEDSEDAYLDF